MSTVISSKVTVFHYTVQLSRRGHVYLRLHISSVRQEKQHATAGRCYSHFSRLDKFHLVFKTISNLWHLYYHDQEDIRHVYQGT